MFALFIFAAYYPRGGWDDLMGLFESAEEALVKAKELIQLRPYECEFGHIVNLTDLTYSEISKDTTELVFQKTHTNEFW